MCGRSIHVCAQGSCGRAPKALHAAAWTVLSGCRAARPGMVDDAAATPTRTTPVLPRWATAGDGDAQTRPIAAPSRFPGDRRRDPRDQPHTSPGPLRDPGGDPRLRLRLSGLPAHGRSGMRPRRTPPRTSTPQPSPRQPRRHGPRTAWPAIAGTEGYRSLFPTPTPTQAGPGPSCSRFL